jgi:hypothetical protein
VPFDGRQQSTPFSLLRLAAAVALASMPGVAALAAGIALVVVVGLAATTAAAAALAAAATTAAATAAPAAGAINMAEFFWLQIAHLLHSQNTRCAGRTLPKLPCGIVGRCLRMATTSTLTLHLTA